MNDGYTIKDDVFTNSWNHILSERRQQIYSITFYNSSGINQFFSSLNADLSFDHLRILIVWDVQYEVLISILIKLAHLPCLQSFTVHMNYSSINITEIYRLVFKLTMLKYYKFSLSDIHLPISTVNATIKQLSYISFYSFEIYARVKWYFK